MGSVVGHICFMHVRFWVWSLARTFLHSVIRVTEFLVSMAYCNNLKTSLSHLMTKPTKWHVCPANTQISLGICLVWSESFFTRTVKTHPPSLIRVFAVRVKKACVLSYPLSAQRRLWSDWTDAQADLSFRWAHTHFVGFVMRRLIYWDNQNIDVIILKFEEWF